MNFYRLDYAIEKVLKNGFSSREQNLLREFAGRRFSREEAKSVWEKVLDHKWYLSEQLQRDVGLHVAATDFVENLYKPRHSVNDQSENRRVPFKVFSQYDFFADVLEN